MSKKFQARTPLYPLFAFNLGVFILLSGLMLAKNKYTFYFLIGLYFMFLIFGYHKACLGILPFIIIFTLIFLLPKVSRGSFDYVKMKITLSRLFAFFISMIPMMGIIPIELVRSMRELRMSKKLVLGAMIVFNFFPVVRKEIITCKQAVKTRANKKMMPPNILYRAYIIPFITNLIKISEIISMSIETRGFSLTNYNDTIYKNIKLTYKDFLFNILFAIGLGCVIFL